MEPSPPVGFNLTFVCPEGEVFDHDWWEKIKVVRDSGDSGLQRPLSKSPVKTPVLLILQSGMDSTAFSVSLMRSSSKLCSQPRCDFIFYFFSATTTECFDCTTTSKWNNQTERHRNTKITSLRLTKRECTMYNVQCTLYTVHCATKNFFASTKYARRVGRLGAVQIICLFSKKCILLSNDDICRPW